MHTKLRRTLAVGTAAAALLGASGCTDITTEPRSTVTGANIFNDPSSYRAFLAKLYAGLAVTGQQGPAGAGDISGIDEGFSHYVRLLWQMQELPTDEAAIAWGDGTLQQLNTQTWNSSNEFLTAMYYRIFFQVALANEFLRETTDEKLNQRGVSGQLRTEIQQYRAEARYLRALSYWHGIDLFGNIPLVRETDRLGAEPPKQATRAEVFNFLVTELNEIGGQLPAPRQGQYGRADRGAVQMLLAKLYLNAEAYGVGNRYGDVITALQPVLTGYSLDPNFRRMFQADNHTSPELVFVVPQDGINTRTWGGMTFLVNAAIGGNMNPANYGVGGGWWGLRVKPEVVSLFPGGASCTGDVRCSHFFTSGHTVQMNSLTEFSNGIGAPKFQNVTSTGRPGSHRDHPDTDYPMFRLGDAYLMYAEAHLRGGGGTRAQALSYVNALRQRANAQTVTDAQLSLNFIRDERARELLWEGHRRTDLVRFGVFTGGSYVWAWKGSVREGTATQACKNLYPLPASEMVANRNLQPNGGC